MHPTDFGWALGMLKQGKAMARKGWNGKGMFIYLVPPNAYPAQTGVAKKHFGENASVSYRSYIAIKTVQGWVVPWIASQTDLIAEDWEEVEIT